MGLSGINWQILELKNKVNVDELKRKIIFLKYDGGDDISSPHLLKKGLHYSMQQKLNIYMMNYMISCHTFNGGIK